MLSMQHILAVLVSGPPASKFAEHKEGTHRVWDGVKRTVKMALRPHLLLTLSSKLVSES